MVETIGNKLQRARLEKKIALEDAAYATKIHAARLSDIETDVYTNFPNIAYAKGFLQIYSNYLGVDAQPYLSAFEDANTFGLDDYQYLSDVPIAQFRAQRRTGGLGGGGGGGRSLRQRHWRSRRLLTVGIALVTLAASSFVWYLVLSFQRLGNLDQLASRNSGGGSSSSNGTTSAAVSPVEKKDATPPVAENEKRPAPSAPAGDVIKTPGGTTLDRDAAISTISGSNSNPATAPVHSGLPNTLTALPEEGPFAAALVPSLGRSDVSVVTTPAAASATPAEASGASTPEPPVRVALPVVPTPRSSTANHASKTATAVRR